MTGYQNQARLFKALMHPARLAILDILRDGEQCVCHIEYLLGYRQAYISQQLSVLRENDLVTDRRDGLNIYYHVSNPEVFTLIDQAAHMTGSPARQPHPVSAQHQGDRQCPCPRCCQALEKAQLT
jgi:DNA-binding transcriptional ArsR family regulator